MVDLAVTYEQLARPASRADLTEIYNEANRLGKELRRRESQTAPELPVGVLATAIPPLTSLRVAINVLHVLPRGYDDELPNHLLDTIERNAADVLHRCHRALELDGEAHGYTADEWLPIVCDLADALLRSASLEQEPPAAVHETQDAVRWLSRGIISLEQDSPDTPTALAEALGRLLVLFRFARLARETASA